MRGEPGTLRLRMNRFDEDAFNLFGAAAYFLSSLGCSVLLIWLTRICA